MTEISQWLMTWAPTIWYLTAFAAFWCGSGAFVFRSVMRARNTSGYQQSARAQSVWMFPSARMLIGAALVGPVLAVPFALLYDAYTTWRRRL